LSETLLFFKEFFLNKQSIGGVKPSSRFLAKEIASSVNHFKGPKRVLEIGAGTGIITEEIVKNLGKADSLTIVEINPQFAKLLKFKKNEWESRDNCPHIEIINIDFLKYESEKTFDAVIAGVPFNNFPVEIIEGFIQKIKSLSKEGSLFAFFEYLAVKKFKAIFLGKSELSSFFEREVYKHLVREKRILRNVPPAKVNFIRFY
jgi:phospholipid N-methyltransferase